MRIGDRLEESEIACYKCRSQKHLCVEEKEDIKTGKMTIKNFICKICAGIFKKEEN